MDKRPAYRIYRSFGEALDQLTDEELGKMFRAINAYALDGIEPELEGHLNGFFILMKPILDSERQNYENGKSGGKPKANRNVTESKPEANPSVTDSKPEANPSVTDSEPKANRNVTESKPKEGEKRIKNKELKEDVSNDTSKKKPKLTHGQYHNVSLTEDELSALKREYGEQQTMAAIKFLDEYIQEKGYKSKNHYLTMRRWVFDAVNNRGKRCNANQPFKQTDMTADMELIEQLYLQGGDGCG